MSQIVGLSAVIEDVNELRWCVIPLLAPPQGGVAASSKKCCEATKADAAGVVFLLFSIGKPPRPRVQRRLRGILLIARPPLLAVMQVGEYARFQFIHIVIDRRYSFTARARGQPY